MVIARDSEPESAIRYVARAVGKDIRTEAELDQAKSFTDQFRNSYFEVQAEVVNIRESELCTEDRSSRSFDEAVDRLDKVSELRLQMLDRNLQSALASLNDSETSAFFASLVKIRLESGYSEIDTRTYYESNTGVNIWESIESTCKDPLPTLHFYSENQG